MPRPQRNDRTEKKQNQNLNKLISYHVYVKFIKKYIFIDMAFDVSS